LSGHHFLTGVKIQGALWDKTSDTISRLWVSGHVVGGTTV